MTTDISVLGVAGIDGVVPVYDPSERWRIWALFEIYDGTVGRNRFVPKVNDYVIDTDTFTTYVVKSIDAVTLISELVEKRPANMSYSFSTTDVLFGTGPGTEADTFLAYLDTSVLPYVMNVDGRLKIGGSMSSYAKLFLGADTTPTGTVVSRMYDASGNFISDRVPLELVRVDSHINYSEKKMVEFATNVNLVDGELVTAVFYTVGDHVVSKRQLKVVNTSFVVPISDTHRFVKTIHLESGYLSETAEGILEFPLNTPVNALNLFGVVTYSDGSTLRLPVDGTKFKIFGLDQYVSTIVGQRIELVLSYALGENESTYNAVTSDNRYMTAAYSIVTMDPNNAYTVKVFGYPVWVSTAIGYVMHWYLLNLDRNVYFDVTSYVTFAPNTGAFNPKGYGYLQRKAIQLNLRSVSGAFKPYIHTQLVDIVLNGPPSGTDTPWTVSNAASSANEMYGAGLYAKLNGTSTQGILKVDAGLATLDQWLDMLYYKSYPLVDLYKESVPPTPTHFEVIFAGTKKVYTIDKWNQLLTLDIAVPAYSTVFIRFYKWTAAAEMSLSIVGLIVSP